MNMLWRMARLALHALALFLYIVTGMVALYWTPVLSFRILDDNWRRIVENSDPAQIVAMLIAQSTVFGLGLMGLVIAMLGLLLHGLALSRIRKEGTAVTRTT